MYPLDLYIAFIFFKQDVLNGSKYCKNGWPIFFYGSGAMVQLHGTAK